MTPYSTKVYKFSAQFLAVLLMLLGLVAALNVNATTFYSKASGVFSDNTNWNDAADGTGSDALLADLASGTHDFVIQTTHDIQAEYAFDIVNLTIEGTGRLRYIAGSTGLSQVVRGDIDIQAAGGAIHRQSGNFVTTLTLYGGISNEGTFDLYTNNNRKVQLSITSNAPRVIDGGGSYEFAELDILPGSNTTTISQVARWRRPATVHATLTTTAAMDIDNDFTVKSTGTWNAGAVTHTVGRNFTLDGGGTFNHQNGEILFDGDNRTINGDFTFYDFTMQRAAQCRLTWAGDITVDNDLLIENTDGAAISTLTLGNNGTARAFVVNGNVEIDDNCILQTRNGNTYIHTFEIGGSFTIENNAGVNFRQNGNRRTNVTFSNNVARPTIVGTPQYLTYNAVTLGANSNTYTIDMDMSIYGDITINSGATLDIEPNRTVTLNDGSVIANSGTLEIVGTVGNEITIEEEGNDGGYTITQTAATGTLKMQHYVLTECDGITVSDGALDGTNNFSDGTFSNGSGTEYLNLTGLNLGGGTTVTGLTLNAGPTYGITRTSGTGTITVSGASSTLGNEGSDQDDGNPGTLIDFDDPSSTYYSQGDGDFSTVANWNTNPGGGGSSPTFDDMRDSSIYLIIQDGHTITLDTSVAILELTVGEGTSGALVIGNNTDDDTLRVKYSMEVASGGSVTTGAYNVTNYLRLQGSLTNNGSVDLKNAAGQVTDFVVHGDQTIGGTPTKTELNNLFVNEGTLTSDVALDINGSVTIQNGCTWADGGNSHTVEGNWTESGTGARTGAGTITLDASIVQSVTAAANFNNLVIGNGQIVSFGGDVDVDGNMTINGNSTVNTATDNTFAGDFTLAAGSFYTASAGDIDFDGSSGQTIDLSGTSAFNTIQFSNGGGAKSITGNVISAGRLRINAGATVDGAGDHEISGSFRNDGTCNFSGSILLNGTGNLDIRNGTGTTFTTGTATVEVASGNYEVEANDTWTINNTLTISGGTLAILADAAITQGGASKALVMTGTGQFHLGDNVVWPAGFASYSFGANTEIDFDGAGAQTVKGGLATPYQNLTISGGGTNTADGVLDVEGDLTINGGSTLDMSTYSHTLAGDIGIGGASSITSTGTVTFDAADANQTIAATTGSYTFNNLIFTNTAPTGVNVKTIGADTDGIVVVNGAFTATNTGGTASNYLRIDLGGTELDNDAGDAMTVGANVRVRNNGANNFENTVGSFGSLAFDAASTVWFHGGAQNVPGMTYGNIILQTNGAKTVQGVTVIAGDITREANTPVFTDNGQSVTCTGDWLLAQAYTTMTGTTTFDGASQTISASNFNDVIFATATSTKTASGAWDIAGNVTINTGVTVTTASGIDLGGNWTEAGTASFTQSAGTTTIDGAADQTVTQISGSSFNNVNVDKGGASDLWQLLTDVTVGGAFTMSSNNCDLDLNGFTLFVGGNFNKNASTTLTHNNGTVHLNGGTGQTLNNVDTDPFYDLVFSGAGTKTLDDNDLDVDNDLTITGSVFNGSDVDINVAGNWTNTGTFQHNNGQVVVLDGTTQTVSASQFRNLVCDNSGTKTLSGDITCSQHLTIIGGVTLDVGVGNNQISVEQNWTNGGTFEPRQGTVVFNGANGNLTSGGTGVGFRFYNVEVAKTVGQRITLTTNHIDIENDLILTQGEFRTGSLDVNLGGGLVNTGGTYNASGAGAELFFDGTSGTHSIIAGTGVYRDVYINGSGGTWELDGDWTIRDNDELFVQDGTLDLNANDLTMGGAAGHITVSGGILEVDSAATLKLANGATLTNSGGTVKVVGNSGAPGTVSVNGVGNYSIVQTSGTFHAKYFRVENTSGQGVDLQGGSIDNTNNFSDGTFTGGTGTAYLTTTGINVSALDSIRNTVFNTGPTYNVERTAGTGTMIFKDASGSGGGEAFDNDDADPGTLIDWVFPNGYYWDGDTDQHWDEATNWEGNTMPPAGAKVYLNHKNVSGAYQVDIDQADAICQRLTIQDDDLSGAITLVLNGYELEVTENMIINTSCVVTQTGATDTLKVGGNWTNAGTLNEGTSVVMFNGSTGTHTIQSGGAGDPFNTFIIDADGAQYNMASDLNVDGDLKITAGTFDVSSGNYDITVAGNWEMQGVATFDPQTGAVTFDKSSGTQSINGGTFYDVNIGDGGQTQTVSLTGNIIVSDDLTINSGSTLDGQTNFIYVADDWVNNVGAGGFTQSGAGTVVFNASAAAQSVTGSAATTFNNVLCNGSQDLTWSQDATIDGNFNVAMTAGSLILSNGYTISAGAGSNTFEMSNGTVRVLGEAPGTNFPASFETYNLSAGTVTYRANANQEIYPTTYYNLEVRRANNAAAVQRTLQGDITVTNNIIGANNRAVVFDPAGYTVYVGNNWTVNTGSSVDWVTNGGKVVWQSAANINIDADHATMDTVVFTGGANYTLLANTTINGDLTVENSSTLIMGAFSVGGAGGFTLDLKANSEIRSARDAADGVAFATGFGTYSLDPASTVTINGSTDQTIYTNTGALDYGNLTVSNNSGASTVTPDEDLDVDGDFSHTGNCTFADGGFDVFVAGDCRIEDETLTGTLTLDGADQVLTGGGATAFTTNDITFSGSGTKTINTATDIDGNLTIDPSIIVTLGAANGYDMTAAGDFTNNGTFNYAGSQTDLTFDGASPQAIDPGTNTIRNLTFTGASTKTVSNNGFDINSDLTVTAPAVADFGAVTHTIFDDVTVTGTWTTTNANLTFDGDNQTIPAITAQDIILTATNVTMGGAWSIDDLTIDATSDLASGSNDLTVTGNWTNGGTFNEGTGTVYFESSDGTAKTITTGGDDFYNVTFNNSQTNTRTYSMVGNTTIRQDLTINDNATFDLNGNDLTIGQNDADVEGITINQGGKLEIDGGATVYMSCSDGDAPITVNGSGGNPGVLKVVGSAGNVAAITRLAGASRINIDINANAELEAAYYSFSYLVDAGLYLDNNAALHTTNYLNNGSFNEINTGGTARYLELDCPAPADSIMNVTWNFSGTPTPGTHYNVQRAASATGDAEFGGDVAGLLAGETYEDEGSPGKIDWAPVSTVTWTGAINTEWDNPGNWSPANVPNANRSAVIPLVTNNPVISTGDAAAKNIDIQDGILTITGGYDLDMAGNMDIGTTGAGILAIGDAGSVINCGGSWSVGATGVFTHGSSTVIFDGSSGAVSIDPRATVFNNVTMSGGATYNLTFSTSSTVDIDGNLTVSAGTLDPQTNNYILEVAGNMNCTGGTFSDSRNGTVVFDGAAQTITAVTFDMATFSGSNTKTTNGAITFADVVTINSTASVATGSSWDVNANLTIASGGTLNNAGQTINFSGQTWTGTGTYSGTGTVDFDRGGNQFVDGSSNNNFHSISLSNDGRWELQDELNMTGDLTVNAANTQVRVYSYQLTNTSGTGTFTLPSGETVRVEGASNFPAGFSTYTFGATSNAQYYGAVDQAIAALNGTNGTGYGNLVLQNANTKTLAGNIVVQNNLTFDDATLASANYRINIGGDWDNGGTGSFTCGTGEVVFDGGATQNLDNSATGTKTLYNVTVNHASTRVEAVLEGPVITGNLNVDAGIYDTNNENTTIGGDMKATGGTFASGNTGTFTLNRPSGLADIEFNGSTIHHLVINSGATYTVQDELRNNGNFTLTAGTFDGNGQTCNWGNGADNVSISGTYKVGAGGFLKMGDNASLTVNSTGTIEVIGSTGGDATVTRQTTGRYNFTVDGTIAARYYAFSYMRTGGILINSGATIDATNHFQDGSFSDGQAGGTYLRVENTQTFSGGSRIENVSFIDDPGSGATNVSKLTAGSGTLEFYNALGAFSGESFDNDASDLIDWTGPVTLTWTGAVDTDWFDAGNWSASTGPDKVPTVDEDVVIPFTVTQPILNTGGAKAKSLTIELGAVMSMATPVEAGNDTDLVVTDDISIAGSLIMGSDDTLAVGGNWARTGTFTHGNGVVMMNPASGTKTLNNGATPFYKLSVAGSGTVQLGANTVVDNNVHITGTMDVSSSDYSLTVKGSFTNTGTFNAQSGTVTFAATSGTKSITTGGSAFNDVVVNPSTGVTYNLGGTVSVDGDLTLSKGTLNLGAQTLNMGDGTGSDVLTIASGSTFKIGANGNLDMGASADVQVSGVFNIEGTNSSNVATLSRQSSGTYSFSVNSGGMLEAQYYLMEYMNATGIRLKSGSKLHGTKNLRDGTFQNGTSGGQYLLIQSELDSSRLIMDTKFNTGPDYSVTKTSGTNTIRFHDATGGLGVYLYEQDDLAVNATAGLLRWSYTNTILTWTGASSSDWDDIANWNPSSIPPDETTKCIIPNVGTDPIIDGTLSEAPTDTAKALDILILSGGVLTIAANKNLNSYGDINIDAGGTLTVDVASTSTSITLEGSWSNSGTFNANTSNVRLNVASGTESINSNGSAFDDLSIIAAGTFNVIDDLDVNGDLSIINGTLDVTTNNRQINVGGSWSNNGGTLVERSGTVVFDGTAGHTVTITGGATNDFYNFTKSGSGAMTANDDINIDNDFTVSDGSIDMSNNNINVGGDWNWTSAGSMTQLATLVIDESNSGDFNHLSALSVGDFTVNRPGETINLYDLPTVTGTFTMTDGVVDLKGGTLACADIVDGGNDGFVTNGSLQVSYLTADIGSTVTFPIGTTTYHPFTFKLNSATAVGLANVMTLSITNSAHPQIGTATKYLNVYWTLSPSDITDPNYDISMQYVDADLSAAAAASEGTMLATKWDGAAPWLAGGAVDVINNVLSYGGYTSFSDFTGGGNGSLLPIELLEWNAEYHAPVVDVTWTTSTETNNDYFEVERSEDGETFETIGVVQGAGNSTVAIQYDYTDEQPIPGISYYRLKQTDYDGAFEYFDIVAVNVTEEMAKKNVSIEFSVFPNPSNGQNINIASKQTYEPNEEVLMLVRDMQGREIYSKVVLTSSNGQFHAAFDPSDRLPKGIYVIIGTNKDQMFSQKLVIE